MRRKKGENGLVMAVECGCGCTLMAGQQKEREKKSKQGIVSGDAKREIIYVALRSVDTCCSQECANEII